MLEKLQMIAEELKVRRIEKRFRLYSQNDDFKIYRYMRDERIELAILNSASEPHYHTDADALFYFVNDGILWTGGCDLQGNGFVTSQYMHRGQSQFIPRYALHSVETIESEQEQKLLIFNSIAPRERGDSAYTLDTVKPKTITKLASSLVLA